MVDDAATQAALSAMIVRLRAASKVAAMKGILVIQNAGMQRSGGLTFEKVTGTTKRSWHAEPINVGGMFGAQTGPTTVYARRLELGFYNMTDSLGRHYYQRAKPFVRPAFLEALPEAKAVINATYAAALRG